MRHRAPLATALAAVVALSPLLALPALGSSVDPAASTTTGDAAAPGPKVVIVVGATEGTTASYRADADMIAAEALKYTSNVIKLYSPNATWDQVRAAAQGASIFVYLGHGYGYPSPYRPVLSPSVQDGMGLNEIGGVSDSDKKYYGESSIANEIRFAKDAIVLLNHLCYSAGSSESGAAEPTIGVARERVDNYASGFIKAGARTVIAQSWTSGVLYAIRSIFTTDKSILDVWEAAPNRQGHVQPFVPIRNPQFEARLDPDTMTTGFHRSIVSATGHTTAQIRNGAAGAQTLAAGATPEIWSIDGATALKPNFDGKVDRLTLLARFSEPVSWKATIRNGAGDTVRSQTGSGHQAAITWDVKVGGDPAPEGDYTWNLSGVDGAGGTVESSGPITVAYPATPPTGVLTFKPTTPTTTTVGTINYQLVFASPVTGLARSDFTRTGTAAGCVLSAIVAAGPRDGTEYAFGFTSCGTGTVTMYLNAGQVIDAALAAGPAGPVGAAKVTIDTTTPKVTIPKASLRTGVALEGASTTQRLLMTVSWTGTDAGAGIASYDVGRSYDGAAFATIASATTATSLNWTMTPGRTYRFRVRARDKAGNVGAWVATSTWYPKLVQQSASSLAWTGTWSGSTAAEHSGGTAKQAVDPAGTVSYAFSGRAVSWVTTLRPENGMVQVWVDGVLSAAVDTHADAATYRQVVFAKGWSGYGAHTIKLVNLATGGNPGAELDAFEVIN
ncbi:MAG TPA: hypothetical protein VM451_00885 [Candidatus Limnocylindria bacterium]|nr:hypothetical protein [Candidatus Limnocylindria bacterium]